MVAFPLSAVQRRVAALVLVCLVAGVVLVRQSVHRAAGSPPLRVAPISAASRRAPAARPLVVDVVGAVRRPGVYRLRQGDRVGDAVTRAGGLTRGAERNAVNLAAPLADGEQVVVATRGSPITLTGGGGGAPGTPVSLSSATAEQLDALPGVGPVTAQKIIDYRTQHGPFNSVDELDAIPGIGPSKLSDLRALVTP